MVEAYPCLNLRSEIGLWNHPLDCLETDTRVEILGAEEGWRNVRLVDGREGWVAASYLVPLAIDAQTPNLDDLTWQRDDLLRRLESAEADNEHLQEQLRTIQEEIDRIRTESPDSDEEPN